MKLQLTLAACLLMTAACSKNKGTPQCNGEALSSFATAVESHQYNQRIQSSNAVTLDEKTEAAENLKTAIQSFNKSSGGTCRATIATPRNCEVIDLSTDTLNQESVKKYADKNAMLYHGTLDNKDVLIVESGSATLSCPEPGPAPAPAALEITEATSLNEMISSFEKQFHLPVDLESYPGYGDGEVNSLFGDGQSSDSSSTDYTELELNQIRMLLLIISQSKGIQDLMKDVGIKGIEILNPYVNKTKAPFVTHETKEGKRVKVGQLKLSLPLYSTEDQIIEALAAGVIEHKEGTSVKEEAFLDEVQPRKHEQRETELRNGDTIKLQPQETFPADPEVLKQMRDDNKL